MTAANRELIRAINRFNILNAIRTSGRLSRVAIARATGLSQASVTGITAELLGEGLLVEQATGESLGGRRPVLLALNPGGAYALGVYLSIHQISVVIIDFEATILATHELVLEQNYYAPEVLADKVAQAVQACLWQANFAKAQIVGVGVGIPGLVDYQTGRVRFLPNYQWENVDLRDLIRQRLDHPTYIENSANTLAIAEQWFGEGRGLDHFVLVTLEHGVGLGVVINGQLYRGAQGVAGEFGHFTIDPGGPECRCGRRGCLEAVVGNYAILREARQAASQGRWQPPDPERVTIEEVLQAARAGHPVLRRIYAEAGATLGVALSNLIVLFNPGKVFVSGRGTAAGDLLFGSLRAAVPHHISPKLDNGTPIIVKDWAPTDYARGAGALVLQEIYRHPASGMVPLI